MARSSVSLVIEAFFAASTASRRRGFMLTSAPLRAAIMISFASFVKTRPLASAAATRPFCFHCAPMREVYREIRPRGAKAGFSPRDAKRASARVSIDVASLVVQAHAVEAAQLAQHVGDTVGADEAPLEALGVALGLGVGRAVPVA